MALVNEELDGKTELDREPVNIPTSGLGFITPPKRTDVQNAALSRGIGNGLKSGARASGFQGGQIDTTTKNLRPGNETDTGNAAPAPTQTRSVNRPAPTPLPVVVEPAPAPAPAPVAAPAPEPIAQASAPPLQAAPAPAASAAKPLQYKNGLAGNYESMAGRNVFVPKGQSQGTAWVNYVNNRTGSAQPGPKMGMNGQYGSTK